MSRVAALLAQHDNKNKRIAKWEAGETKLIRFLPPYDVSFIRKARAVGGEMDPQTGIFQCSCHSFLPRLPLEKSEKDKTYFSTNWRCLMDLKKPCPFCSFFDALGKDDWDIKRQHGRKMNPCVDIYLPKTGACQRWFMSKTVLKRIGELYDTLPQINHPKKGRNIFVKRTGTKFDTEYHFKVSEKETPLKLPEDQFPDDIIKEVDEMPIIKGPKSANLVLKAAFPDML